MSSVGRPTLYNKQTCDIICARVARGESLRGIGASKNMPADSTIALWLSLYPEFSEQYRLAYESNLLVEAYSMREMIDNVPLDALSIAKMKEQIAHRKWELKIRFPKVYGDKPEPTVIINTGLDTSKLSDKELDEYTAALEKMTEKN